MLDTRIQTILSAEGMDKHLMLPDRMTSDNKSIRDKIWSNVFFNRRKLKDVADTLAKSRALDGVPRKVVRALEPEDIVSQLLSSRESRYSIFGDHVGFDYESWVALVMACHERVSKKLVEGSVEDLGFDYALYNINLDANESSDPTFLKALKSYAIESNVTKLAFEDRDLVDFVVNAVLAEIGDFQFIVDFMAKYPWCAERNTKFMSGARIQLEEELSSEAASGTARPECGKRFESFLINGFRHLSKTITPGERLTLTHLLSMSTIAVDLLGHETFGMAVQLQECLNYQQKSLAGYINVSLEYAHSTPGFVANERFVQCNALAAAPIEPFVIQSPVSAEVIKVLGDYAERMNENSKSVSEYPEALNDEIAEFRRLKEEVAVAATAESMDIDALSIKIAQLKERNDKIHVLAEKVFSLFLSIFDCFAKLRVDLEKIAADKEPVILPVEAQPESTPAVDTQAMARQLEEAEETINTLERQNEDLSTELTSVKKDNHALKVRIDSTKEVTDTAPFSQIFDQPTLLALMGRTRTATPLEILMAFKAMVPERLEILPSAIESAKNADNFEGGPRLSVLMEKLVFTYLDSINEGNPDSVARKVFAHAYAAKESETVTSNKRLRAMREFIYKGKKVLMLQHVGIGRNYGTQHSIKLYFQIIDDKVVIGWCGEHLETAGTN
jgi:hypothetical protein